jgi:hypothetical protein
LFFFFFFAFWPRFCSLASVLLFGLGSALWPQFCSLASVLLFGLGSALWPRFCSLASVLLFGLGSGLWPRFGSLASVRVVGLGSGPWLRPWLPALALPPVWAGLPVAVLFSRPRVSSRFAPVTRRSVARRPSLRRSPRCRSSLCRPTLSSRVARVARVARRSSPRRSSPIDRVARRSRRLLAFFHAPFASGGRAAAAGGPRSSLVSHRPCRNDAVPSVSPHLSPVSWSGALVQLSLPLRSAVRLASSRRPLRPSRLPRCSYFSVIVQIQIQKSV